MRFTLNTADDLPSYKELPLWASLDGLLTSSKFPSFQQLKLIIDAESLHWDAHSRRSAPSVLNMQDEKYDPESF